MENSQVFAKFSKDNRQVHVKEWNQGHHLDCSQKQPTCFNRLSYFCKYQANLPRRKTMRRLEANVMNIENKPNEEVARACVFSASDITITGSVVVV